jgi:hypothetical protein
MPKARRIEQQLIWKTTEEMEEYLRPKTFSQKLFRLVAVHAKDTDEEREVMQFIRNVIWGMAPIWRLHDLMLSHIKDQDAAALLRIIEEETDCQTLLWVGLTPGPMRDAFIELIGPGYLKWKELAEKNAALAEAELARRGMNGHGQV